MKAGILSIVLCLFLFPSLAQSIKLGIASPLERDELLYESGFRITGTGVQAVIAPSLSDSAFNARKEQIKKMKCEVFMCNVLFPGSIKIAGPDVDEEKALAYLQSVLQRAKEAGIKNLLLGSGGARRLPDGYDKSLATENFIKLCARFANLAQQYEVMIILENLNSTETNFINTLNEAAHVVRSVNHPSFKLNADIYHMMKENESPEEIIKAGDLIVYSELAEREQRTLPGVMKDDFVPYLKALNTVGFKGAIMIEGRTDDFRKDIPRAYKYLKSQLKAAGFKVER